MEPARGIFHASCNAENVKTGYWSSLLLLWPFTSSFESDLIIFTHNYCKMRMNKMAHFKCCREDHSTVIYWFTEKEDTRHYVCAKWKYQVKVSMKQKLILSFWHIFEWNSSFFNLVDQTKRKCKENEKKNKEQQRKMFIFLFGNAMTEQNKTKTGQNNISFIVLLLCWQLNRI